MVIEFLYPTDDLNKCLQMPSTLNPNPETLMQGGAGLGARTLDWARVRSEDRARGLVVFRGGDDGGGDEEEGVRSCLAQGGLVGGSG
jgi:hypothetical protein